MEKHWQYKYVKKMLKEKHPEINNLKFLSDVQLEGLMFDALEKLDPLLDHLESIIDGRAFCQETGLIWKHRFYKIKEDLEAIKNCEGK